MKKFILLVVLPLFIAGCVPKSELEKANANFSTAQEKIKTLQKGILDAQAIANTNLTTQQERIKSLQEDLGAAQNQIKSLQGELSALKNELSDAQEELQSTKLKLAQKSIVPVRVGFRKAALGAGYVAVFNTTIKQDFPILVRYSSKALGFTKSFQINLSSSVPSELGYAQGATIEDGDVIEISNTNFEPKTVVFHQP